MSCIVQGAPEFYALNECLLMEKAEVELYTAYLAAHESLNARKSADGVLNVMLSLTGPVKRFFQQVLVMDDDVTLRQARLGLLQHIARLPEGVVDLRKVSTT